VFFFLSKILDVLLTPIAWSLLLAVTAGMASRGRARAAAFASAVLLYAFSVEPLANALQRYIEKQPPGVGMHDGVYDAVVLLGGAVDHQATAASGQLSLNDDAERFLFTYDLLRAGRARVALLSGGTTGPDDPVGEAAVLAGQLRAWGIDPSRLVLDDRPRNTHENAAFSARIARERGLTRLLVVTSARHMTRALDCFRAEGMNVDGFPVDHRAPGPGARGSWLPRAAMLERSESVLRELAGRVIYRAVGYGKSAN
jgi:uncharacterized SAM-binding protein YcdF (DUF218 family)